MKPIFTILLFVCAFGATKAQQAKKVVEVHYTSSIRIENGYSPDYGGWLVTGNFLNFLMTTPPNGQTQSFGHVAIYRPDGSLLNLNGGLTEQTTAGIIIGTTIYVATISGNVWMYTPQGGWTFLYSVNGTIYALADAGNNNLLTIGKYTSLNGEIFEHIARYDLDSSKAYCVGDLPSLESPTQMFFENCEVVTTPDAIYFTWFNTTFTDNGLYIYDKAAKQITTPPFFTTTYGMSLAVDGKTVYFVGRDANGISTRMWEIHDTSATELCTFDGTASVSAMVVRNGILYGAGDINQISPPLQATQNIDDDFVYSSGTFSHWNKAPEDLPFEDIVVSPDGDIVASTGSAIYSTRVTTSIPELIPLTLVQISPDAIKVIPTERTSVTITNMLGQKMYEQTIDNEVIIDISTYPKAAYSLNGKLFTNN